VTLRAQTERPVTVTEGTNRLAPWPLTADGIDAAHAEAETMGRSGVGERSPEGWDGKAAPRIVDALARA
jgi:UDP-N-acetylglucosamine 2-epimerase (non-hydrolysing)